MKKKLLIFLVLLLVLVTGCAKKDAKSEASKTKGEKEVAVSSVSGKYVMTEPDRNGYIEQGFDKTLTFDGEKVVLYDDYVQSTYTGTYKIEEDGKITLTFTHFNGYSEDLDHNPIDKDVNYILTGKATTKGVSLTKEQEGTKSQEIKEVYEQVKEEKK